MEQLTISKKLPSNHVVIRVRDHDGEVIDIISQPHDGLPENIMNRMSNLQSQLYWMNDVSNLNSQNFATDENGQLRWIISPNCLHMAEVGTKEARYILGDLSARTDD